MNVLFETSPVPLSAWDIETRRREKTSIHRDVVADSVLKLFQELPLRPNAPKSDLADFLEFHRRHAVVNRDTEKLVHIEILKSEGLNNSLIPGLEDSLDRLKKRNERDSEDLLELTTVYSSLLDFSKILIDVVKVTSHAHMSDKFSRVLVNAPTFMAAPEDFPSRFKHSIASFKRDTEKYQQLAAYYHCRLMRSIGFDRFQAAFPNFAVLDRLIYEADESVIRSFCMDPAPISARKLFASPALEESITLLKKGWSYEIPLMALPRIACAIELLNDVYVLANGCPAQADSLTPLIHYLLMKCGIVNVYSYMKYLNGYVRPLLDEGLLVLPEVVGVALTHMVNHVDSLAAFLSQRIHEGNEELEE
jgi:hypothetical protein